MREITVNGIDYVAKEDISEYVKAEPMDGMEYCIIRTYSAGVFAGYVENMVGKEVIIRKVRRIWYWDGANSISQLAKDGTKKPENCKFACEVDKIIVTEAIEVIPCTEKAKASITGVEEWVQ